MVNNVLMGLKLSELLKMKTVNVYVKKGSLVITAKKLLHVLLEKTTKHVKMEVYLQDL